MMLLLLRNFRRLLFFPFFESTMFFFSLVRKLENLSSVNDTFFVKRLLQNIPRVIELDIRLSILGKSDIRV